MAKSSSFKLKRCYYETLGVDPDASDDEIKKAYRYQALKWHPDKNPEDEQLAAIRFKEIQSAYDCLSDVRERAWYDKYRDQILSGLDQDDITDNNSMDLLPYFLSSSYCGYDDAIDNSFYNVYRRLFDEIVKEEMIYLSDEEKDKITDLGVESIFPSFGNSKTEYFPAIHNFYSYWSSFNTRKTFYHIFEYDIKSAANRREARLMEKENNKLREIKKKNRNNEIRSLVAFVKRRDKRLAMYKKQLEDKKVENRNKSKQHRKKQLEERKIDLNNFQESDWNSMANLEASLAKLESDLSNMELNGAKKKFTAQDLTAQDNDQQDEEEDKKQEGDEDQAAGGAPIVDELNHADQDKEVKDEDQDKDAEDEEITEDLFCIACNKIFKSIASFQNHENSKKHKSALAQLKQHLQDDEQLLGS